VKKFANIKKNIPTGIWAHPHHENPGRLFQLCGKSSAVHFVDPALLAI
jgi:hypothetical protein